MIGLTEPTSGAAFVEGSDIRYQMNEIYTSMGVCPQHEYVTDLFKMRVLTCSRLSSKRIYKSEIIPFSLFLHVQPTLGDPNGKRASILLWPTQEPQGFCIKAGQCDS